VLVLTILGALWYLCKPAPAWSAEQALKTCNVDIQDSVLLLKALDSPNENGCAKLQDERMNAYCLAKFGTNICNEILSHQAECNAILQRNTADCADDRFCHAVLGNEAGCNGNNVCIGIARRDLSLVIDPKNCEQVIENIDKVVECTKNAVTPELLAACLNQSSLTV
jgi:hypothetical protein